MAKRDALRNVFGGAPDRSLRVQIIRAIDVFVLGPTMITFAVTARERAPKLVRFFLAGAGAATILFNGVNLYRALGER